MVQTAYDIIKAHGGEMKVESQPTGRTGKVDERNSDNFGKGEGTVFIINLTVT